MVGNDVEKGRAEDDVSHGTGIWAFLSRPFRDKLNKDSSASNPIELERISHGESGRDVDQAQATPSGHGAKDPEKGTYTHAENEGACTKMWKVYVDEADRYDRALVASWKGDMNGMLIFSGLFSASLTAFLVESYKTLQPDATVVLLSQISQQLASASNGKATAVAAQPPFEAPAAAMLCNVLWFLSLALSLTCSLLATLVEQWAREFLHRTEIHPAPARRARVFSFLYLGLKQFHMHAVVDIIPMLLHLSLFFFFGGLIAFLLPVNVILMYLMSIVLAVFLVLYIVLTVLPIYHRASPYRTPLSTGLWRLRQYLGNGERDCTMAEAVSEEALMNSADRDRHAVQWTVASLTDDSELLPLVEAIPDVIYGPKGFHHVNDHLLQSVLDVADPQSRISTRIVDLLRSSENLQLDGALRTRRQTACLKAIWALGMRGANTPQLNFWFARSAFDALGLKTLDPHYTLSVRYVLECSRRSTSRCRMIWALEAVRSCDTDVAPPQSHMQIIQTVHNLMDDLAEEDLPVGSGSLSLDRSQSLKADLATLKNHLTGPHSDTVAVRTTLGNMRVAAENLVSQYEWDISRVVTLCNFLRACLKAAYCPYEFHATCDQILPDISDITPSENGIPDVQLLLDELPNPSEITEMTSEIHDIDRIIKKILPLLPFMPRGSDAMSAMYTYFANRNSDVAILEIGDRYNLSVLGSCIGQDLAKTSSSMVGLPQYYYLPDDGFKTLWNLLYLRRQHCDRNDPDLRSWTEQLFSALLSHPFSTTMALFSSHILSDYYRRLAEIQKNTEPLGSHEISLHSEIQPGDSGESTWRLDYLCVEEIRRHPLFVSAQFPVHNTTKSCLGTHKACTILLNQLAEVWLSVLTQLLSNHVATGGKAYRWGKTVRLLCSDFSFPFYKFNDPIRRESQQAFAEALRIVVRHLSREPNDSELREIFDHELLWVSDNWEWLDDVASASIIVDAMDVYMSLDGDCQEDEQEEGPSGPSPFRHRARKLREHCRQILHLPLQWIQTMHLL